ncbi:MAG: AI-2E family transporter [Akkermansiaceae bacterium]|nr:AI-2E family transporter [Akkermansiaceae bacterium]
MTPRYPSRFQSRTIWRAITGIAILIIGLLIVGLIWLCGNVFSYLQPVLVPLAFAGITAYLLDPIVSWLQKKGLSRLKAVITVFASFVVFLTLLGLIIIPPIANQISDAFQDKEQIASKATSAMENIKDAPWLKPVVDYASEKVNPETGASVVVKDAPTPPPTQQDENIDKLGGIVSGEPEFQYRWQFMLSKYAGKIIGTTTSWLSEGSSKILSIFGLVLGFAMTPIYLYYFLKESSGIKAHWHEYVPLKASRFKSEVVDTLQEINGYLISFFRGQMLVAFIDGMLVGIALWIFQLPYGLLIGLILAILGVIPFIGNILCMIPACIIAYVHFGYADNQNFLGSNPWSYVAAVVVIFFVVQQINSLVTAPKIVGDSVGLHPMTVIFSMLFWSLLLGGFIGALLAVPLTAAVKVLFRRYVWERKLNESEADESTPSADDEALDDKQIELA